MGIKFKDIHKMNEHPLISIITVSYNARNSIEQTILSVINQTYNNIEYIIIDGHSSDGTVEIIKKYANLVSYWISEPDNGLYDALNKGIERSTGDWIGILNCGDLFHSNDTIYEVFHKKNYSNIDVIFGNSIEVSNNKKNPLIAFYNRNIPPTYRHGASFVRTQVHKRFKFDLSKFNTYQYGLDYYCIYTMYKNNISFKHVNIFILDYLKEGISNNPFKNKYLRSLIENDGKKNIMLYIIICKSLISSIKNKCLRIIK